MKMKEVFPTPNSRDEHQS